MLPILLNHTANTYSDRVIVFGGGTRDGHRQSSDLLSIHIDTTGLASKGDVIIPHPSLITIQHIPIKHLPSLSHHASVMIPPSKLIINGGFNGTARTSDTYCIDLESNTCTQLPCEASQSKSKSGHPTLTGRSSHLITQLSHNTLLLVGREAGQRRWSDTHLLTLTGRGTVLWKDIGEAPLSRSGAMMATLSPRQHVSGHTGVAIWGGRKTSELGYWCSARGWRAVPVSRRIPGISRAGSVYVPGHHCFLTLGGLVSTTSATDAITIVDVVNARISRSDLRLPYPWHGGAAAVIGQWCVLTGGLRGRTDSGRCAVPCRSVVLINIEAAVRSSSEMVH
eukprot:gnl/Dysnectes_brevis/8625_a15462_238.p1 GENE.gnl/Dysnectes_brevis/8625_a15462_238~~gnl/Dysnectes_brevis/8625_a15462_238.p1  ORF type:complete len:337 (-),score=39.34 gnl/Dysnectes_brevis/8625_a15462_238:243-1253(-)